MLKAFPHPLTITAFQFLVGSAVATTMWALRLHPAPKTTPEAIAGVSPLAAVHTLGNALTNVSLGAVAVSFTHTIKALEPFFSVLLSALFLGEQPSAPVILSLFPIIGGVALASTSELSFTWKGFLAAMGSNVTFQSRNVLSKKFMGDKGKQVIVFLCVWWWWWEYNLHMSPACIVTQNPSSLVRLPPTSSPPQCPFSSRSQGRV